MRHVSRIYLVPTILAMTLLTACGGGGKKAGDSLSSAFGKSIGQGLGRGVANIGNTALDTPPCSDGNGGIRACTADEQALAKDAPARADAAPETAQTKRAQSGASEAGESVTSESAGSPPSLLHALERLKGQVDASKDGDAAAPSGLPVLSTRARMATEVVNLDQTRADVVDALSGSVVEATTDGTEPTPDFVQAVNAVSTVSAPTELGITLDSLSGQLYASSQALAFQQSATYNRVLGNRMDRVAHRESEAGGWVDIYGARGTLRQSGYASASTSLWGGQAGMDTRMNDRAVVGVSVNWGDAHAHFNRQAGKSQSNSLGVTLYGRYGEEKGIYAMARAGINRIGSTVQRDVQVAGIHRVQGKRTDKMRSAYAELGYGFDVSETTRITPFGGLAFDQLARDRISESGHTFALQAKSKRFNKTSLMAGLRASTTVYSFAGETSLYAYGLYQQLLSDASLDFTAQYAGASGVNMTVSGIGLQRRTGWVGLGASTQASERLSWNLGLDVQMGRGGLTNKVLSAGIRAAF